MLTTLQIHDSSILGSLRRKTPKAGDVPGLLGSKKALCGPFTHTDRPDLQPSRSMVIGWWEDEDAFETWSAQNPCDGFTVKMRLVRSLGSFPGLDRTHEQLRRVVPKRDEAMDGPTIAVTIGTPYLRTIGKFLKASNKLERQFLDAPGMLWGTGFSPLPFGVASLTFWESTEATMQYMRTAAHGDAIKMYYDPEKDLGGHTFVHSGGFFGFQPISWSGTLDGRNPMPPLPSPVASAS